MQQARILFLFESTAEFLARRRPRGSSDVRLVPEACQSSRLTGQMGDLHRFTHVEDDDERLPRRCSCSPSPNQQWPPNRQAKKRVIR